MTLQKWKSFHTHICITFITPENFEILPDVCKRDLRDDNEQVEITGRRNVVYG